jgi:hypothetical protein
MASAIGKRKGLHLYLAIEKQVRLAYESKITLIIVSSKI